MIGELMGKDFSLHGKSLVITGGSTGLGEGMVKLLSEYGVTGVIFDISQPKEIREGWEYVTCDVSNELSIKEAFSSVPSKFQPLDLLIANAGIVPGWSSIKDTELETWDSVMAVNAKGLLMTLKYGYDFLRKPNSSVVVTASINSLKGDPNIVPYVASKHAALGIVRSAAIDFGKSGIRVNAIAPGPIATDALLTRVGNRSKENNLKIDAALDVLAKQTALGRLATIQDVANAALFLCSNLSNGITGQILNVDSGLI